MRSGDKTILASFPNPCSDNNSPSLPAVSCPSLPHPPPHLPLPQAEWKGVTVLGLTLSTWCQGEEEEEVAGEVPRGHIIVLEYVKQYWHTAEVTYHCTELGTGACLPVARVGDVSQSLFFPEVFYRYLSVWASNLPYHDCPTIQGVCWHQIPQAGGK